MADSGGGVHLHWGALRLGWYLQGSALVAGSAAVLDDEGRRHWRGEGRPKGYDEGSRERGGGLSSGLEQFVRDIEGEGENSKGDGFTLGAMSDGIESATGGAVDSREDAEVAGGVGSEPAAGSASTSVDQGQQGDRAWGRGWKPRQRRG